MSDRGRLQQSAKAKCRGSRLGSAVTQGTRIALFRTPLLLGEDYLTDAVLRFMRDAGVRRVPVTGKQGELVGVLSLDDGAQKHRRTAYERRRINLR